MRRALVVDDARALRVALCAILSRLDFECDGAEDADDAERQINANAPYDLITVDWNMPGRNGLELIQDIRHLDACKSAKIIMVTTEKNIEQVTAAQNAGADDYVMKPFSPQQLSEIISSHF